MPIQVTYYDTYKGEIPPEPGRYSVLFDWDGEWKEFIGTKPPHLWFVVQSQPQKKKRRRKWRLK